MNDERDDQIIDVTARPVDAMPADLMLLKMENESMMAAARIKPRNNAQIVKDLIALVDAYPAAADEAIYSKPVGTVWRIKCGRCGHVFEASEREKNDAECSRCGSTGTDQDVCKKIKKYAEGLSIRAAENIKSLFGYSRIAVQMQDLPDGKVRLIGTFIDYASCTMTTDERIVSPWYTARGGKPTRTPEDRFLSVVVKAEKAKLRRDVILDSVPAIVKAAFRDACENKIRETVTAGYIDDKVMPFVKQCGLTEKDCGEIVGKPRSMGWTNEDMVTLRNVCAAIKNGEMTVAELLAELRDVREDAGETSGRGDVSDNPAASAGAVKPEDLANAGKKPPKSKTKGKPDAGASDAPPATGDAATETKTAEPSDGTLFGGDETADDGPNGGGLPDNYLQAFEARIAEAETPRQLDQIHGDFRACTAFSKAQAKIINLALAQRRKELSK